MKQCKVFEREEIPSDIWKMFKFYTWHPVYMYDVGTFMAAADVSKGISKEQFLAVDGFFIKHGCKVGETIYIEEILY